MTEEEKGAPVWGEEPVKQSGEAAGTEEGPPVRQPRRRGGPPRWRRPPR